MSDPNTSATGGLLNQIPVFGLDESSDEIAGLDVGLLDGSIPVNDQNLDRFLTVYLAQLSGIPANLMRPRWQDEPPNLPAFGTNWAAVGVMDQRKDTYAALLHQQADDGFDELRRHEDIEVLVSFYGPQSTAHASRLADALQVGQNRELLDLNSIGLTDASDVQRLPALIKQRWTKRADLRVLLKRQVKRQYHVLNLLNVDQEGSEIVADSTRTTSPSVV